MEESMKSLFVAVAAAAFLAFWSHNVRSEIVIDAVGTTTGAVVGVPYSK